MDWSGAPLIGWNSAREFILFFLHPRKDKRNPAHKTAHLQTTACQLCKPKFTKELFFSHAANKFYFYK